MYIVKAKQSMSMVKCQYSVWVCTSVTDSLGKVFQISIWLHIVTCRMQHLKHVNSRLVEGNSISDLSNISIHQWP